LKLQLKASSSPIACRQIMLLPGNYLIRRGNPPIFFGGHVVGQGWDRGTVLLGQGDGSFVPLSCPVTKPEPFATAPLQLPRDRGTKTAFVPKTGPATTAA